METVIVTTESTIEKINDGTPTQENLRPCGSWCIKGYC